MGSWYSGVSMRFGVLAAALALVGSACSAPTQYVAMPPETPVWMAGDSMSAGAGVGMIPTPYVASVGASGFSASARTMIIDDLDDQIQAFGQPETVMVMGGAIDIARGVETATIVANMQAFEDHLVSLGIDLVWIAEPGYTYAAGLQLLSDWINAKPLSIDCRAFAGPHKDGVHPASYLAFSQCLSSEMAALGFSW